MPSPIPIPDFTTQPESPEPSSLPDLSPFSNYITQEEVPEKPIPTDYNTQRLGVPTHQEAHTHQPSACITPKNCVQVDLWGKKVPASKLKIKVRSYRKRNGTAVSKYSRKSVNNLPSNLRRHRFHSKISMHVTTLAPTASNWPILSTLKN